MYVSTAGIFQEDRTVVLSTGGDQRLHSPRGVLSMNIIKKKNMEESLFDVNGNPVAYIDYSDEA